MTKVLKKNSTEKNRQLYLDISFGGMILFSIFRIPLTNIIGNEGNGYLAFALEGYAVFSLLFGYAVYQVTLKMVRIRNRKHLLQACSHVFAFCMIICFILSVIGAGILFFGASRNISCFPILTGISFKFLSVLLIIVSMNGVLRGYFEGVGTFIPTSFSKIVEAFVAGTGALIFTSSLREYGTKVGALLINEQYKPAFGATGILLGCICGSFFSLLFLLVVKKMYSYAQHKNTVNEDKKFSLKECVVEFFKVFIIVLLELIFFKSYRLLNILIFSDIYTKTIEGENKLISIIGAYHGKIIVIITILCLLILSFTGKNIGKIRKSYMKRLPDRSWNYLNDDLRKIVIVTLSVCSLVYICAKNILNLLYQTASTTETLYLKVGSFNIILVTISIYLYKILRKLEFNKSLIIIPLIAFVGQSFVMYTMVKMDNLRSLSFVIAEVVFWCIVSVMEYIVIVNALKPELFRLNNHLKKERV